MKRIRLILSLPVFIILMYAASACNAQTAAGSKGFENLTRILASEGISDSVKMKAYQEQYNSLISNITKNIDRKDDVYDQNKDLFKYLHKSYLIKYVDNIRLFDIFDQRFYNCVTASSQYKCMPAEFKKIFSQEPALSFMIM